MTVIGIFNSYLFTSTFLLFAIFKMDKIIEQRICIKFCVKNEIKSSEVVKMLEKSYGNDALKKTNVYNWYDRFKSGREAVANYNQKKK